MLIELWLLLFHTLRNQYEDLDITTSTHTKLHILQYVPRMVGPKVVRHPLSRSTIPAHGHLHPAPSHGDLVPILLLVRDL